MATSIEYGLISALVQVKTVSVGNLIVREDLMKRVVSRYNPVTGEYFDQNGIKSYRSVDPHAPAAQLR